MRAVREVWPSQQKLIWVAGCRSSASNHFHPSVLAVSVFVRDVMERLSTGGSSGLASGARELQCTLQHRNGESPNNARLAGTTS
ncbi:hypothetical protein MRX96_024156 [Rhipicephalus microplus]